MLYAQIMRILILGTSGSGKTTLAKRLAAEFKLEHLELDALNHQANWQPIAPDKFLDEVRAFCAGANWVIDGNYATVRQVILEIADVVILLDYSKPLVMSRVLKRTIGRVFGRKMLWNGNRESLGSLFSLNPEINVVLWAWRTFEERRRSFDELARTVPSTVQVHRLRHPKEIAPLIAKLK